MFCLNEQKEEIERASVETKSEWLLLNKRREGSVNGRLKRSTELEKQRKKQVKKRAASV